MAVNLSPIGNGFQFFDTNGVPLNAGKIYTYQAGSSTPLATYTDNAGSVANTNPIILGTDGRPPSEIWLTESYFYKFILKDSSDVTIQTYDNLYGIIGAIPSVAPSSVPSGCILLWSGSIGSIPGGFVLCNGLNGTPDLRDRFIVGAGSSYAVEAIGGSANSVLITHDHTYSTTTNTTGAHTHDMRIPNSSYTLVPGASVNSSTGTGVQSSGYTVAGLTVSNGDHAHTVSGTTASAGPSDGTNANLPPYFALCYIMKT